MPPIGSSGGLQARSITFLCFELGEARDVLAGLVAAVCRRDLDLTDHCRRQALFIEELLKL
jgi:hypothetical protein